MIKSYSEFKKYIALANKKRRIVNTFITFIPFLFLASLGPLINVNPILYTSISLLFMFYGGVLFKIGVIRQKQLTHFNFNVPQFIKKLDNDEKKSHSLVHCYDFIFSFFLAAQYSELKHHQKNDSFVHSCLFNIEQLRQAIDYNQQALKGTTYFDSSCSIKFPQIIQEKFDEHHQYICDTFHHLICNYIQEGTYLDKFDFDKLMTISDSEKIKMIESEIKSIYEKQAQHNIEQIEMEKKWGIESTKKHNKEILKALAL